MKRCQGLRVARAFGFISVLFSANVFAQEGSCGNPFENHFGPFDYRTANRSDLKLVEGAHFTPGVETLTKPATTTVNAMAGDVAYTLHVFPNHHRALITMARLAERHKSPQPPGARFTVDCYFERAVLFRPDDNVARMLFAQHLGKTGRQSAGTAQLLQAVSRAGDNPLTHYNIGLVALEISDVDLALTQAHRASALGNTRPELEERLRQAGKWRDPQ